MEGIREEFMEEKVGGRFDQNRCMCAILKQQKYLLLLLPLLFHKRRLSCRSAIYNHESLKERK